jgi:hypothetical protein
MIYHVGNSETLTVHGLKSKVRQRTASNLSDGLGGAGRAHCCKIANCEYHCDCATVERVRDKKVYCLARPGLSIICMPKKMTETSLLFESCFAAQQVV